MKFLKAGLIAFAFALTINASCSIALWYWSEICCSTSIDGPLPPRSFIVLLNASNARDLDARVAEADRLASANPTAAIFCMGGARPWRNMYLCDPVVERLAGMGYPRSRLYSDHRSSDKRSNLEVAFQEIVPETSIVVVSDPLHLARARYLAGIVAPTRGFLTSAARKPSGFQLVRRLQWGLAAWASEFMPKSLGDLGIALTRF